MKNELPNRAQWKLKTKTLVFSQTPLIMGIVNATPDSFSDGGSFFAPQDAIEQGLRLANEGAAIIDVGGESTRPYSEPVSTDQEIERVVPVVQGIAARSDVPISIDTSKAAVAVAAIDAGAQIINDVTGLTGDPKMLQVAVESGVGVCAMHMQGTPQTMQDKPHYANVVQDIAGYLKQRKESLLDAGIPLEKICLDPGIGFGKTHRHNLELLAGCEAFLELGCPILIGHSRKGFIGKLLGDKEAERDSGTLAISLLLAQKKMHILRLHQVAPTVAALKVQAGITELAE
ncbi:dihydropteroate synthase [Mariniblastus sp.]|nr:dihydropteroate synthase [Mariniblastus sp.]